MSAETPDSISTKAALTISEVLAFFDEIADDPQMAFNYMNEGCQARAQLMGKRAQEKNIPDIKRAWAFGVGKSLKVTMPNGRTHGWPHHVALAVPVKLDDDKIEDFVFDPGIFDGPVNVAEWGETMGADLHTMDVVGFDQIAKYNNNCYAPGGRREDADFNLIARLELDILLKVQKHDVIRTVIATDFRRAAMAEADMPGPAKGKTWQSAPAPKP